MPYIHLSIAKKLNDHQKEAIMARIGQLIEILPGKSEKVLMIRMDDDVQMVFRGVPCACAYVNVNLYMMSPDNKKAEFAQALVLSLSELAGIELDDIFLSFTEHGNWCSRGEFK